MARAGRGLRAEIREGRIEGLGSVQRRDTPTALGAATSRLILRQPQDEVFPGRQNQEFLRHYTRNKGTAERGPFMVE
jgi:hypothetical protein